MSDPVPPDYPPEQHIVRDLAPLIERDETGSTILLPIVPEILDPGGRVRVGVVATIVDIVAGETAIRAVLPQWIATSTLSLQAGALPGDGTLRARPRILRQGRTTLVMETRVDHLESGRDAGLATIVFSILPNRSPTQARVGWAETPEAKSQFASDGEGFRKPLFERLGVRFDADDPATTRLAVEPYVINTLGAMQGGVVGILIDAASERFAIDRLGPGAAIRSLEIHYLKLARGGPVRASCRVLSEVAGGLLLRVELRDEGNDDVLTTIATVLVESPGR